MGGLLARAALPVDRGAGHRLRKTRGEHRITRDIVGLLADLSNAARDDVVDERRIQLGSLDDGLERVSQQVHRVPVFERAVAAAHGRSNSINNNGFAHAGMLSSGGCGRQSARVIRYCRMAQITPAASSRASELRGAKGHVET